MSITNPPPVPPNKIGHIQNKQRSWPSKSVYFHQVSANKQECIRKYLIFTVFFIGFSTFRNELILCDPIRLVKTPPPKYIYIYKYLNREVKIITYTCKDKFSSCRSKLLVTAGDI